MTPEEAGIIERQLHFVLCRYDTLIQTAAVTLKGTGPWGCQVRLKLRSSSDVAASDRQPELASAVRKAAEKAAATLDRQRPIPRIKRQTRVFAQFGD